MIKEKIKTLFIYLLFWKFIFKNKINTESREVHGRLSLGSKACACLPRCQALPTECKRKTRRRTCLSSNWIVIGELIPEFLTSFSHWLLQ